MLASRHSSTWSVPLDLLRYNDTSSKFITATWTADTYYSVYIPASNLTNGTLYVSVLLPGKAVFLLIFWIMVYIMYHGYSPWPKLITLSILAFLYYIHFAWFKKMINLPMEKFIINLLILILNNRMFKSDIFNKLNSTTDVPMLLLQCNVHRTPITAEYLFNVYLYVTK